MSGNFLFVVMFPFASRPNSQVSSMLTYTYPASRMPLDTIASAIWRTAASSTLPANLFQLFHPIGGVLARPLSGRSVRAGNGKGAGGIVAYLLTFSPTE